LKPAFGDFAIGDLKVSGVNKFLRTVKTKRRPLSTRERPEPKRRRNIKSKPFVAEDLSLSSKRLLRKVLAMALDHAISEDRLSENVARKAKLPKTSEDNTKVPDYFTTDEARQFLRKDDETAEGHPSPIVGALRSSGPNGTIFATGGLQFSHRMYI
jgi:hypothetical protein